MFCNNCGTRVEDEDLFCPNCGARLEQSNDSLNDGIIYTTETAPVVAKGSKGVSNFKKITKKKNFKWFVLGGAVCCVVLVIVLLILNGRRYSVVGEWKSKDLLQVGDMIVEILVDDVGVPYDMADYVVDTLGLNIGDYISFDFEGDDESGYIYPYFHNFTVKLIGDFTYKMVDDTHMRLNFEADIEIPKVGLSIPVSISYKAKYAVTRNTLSLDIFGYTVQFERQ